MSKFKEYLNSIDNKKKIIFASSIGAVFLITGSIASYIIWNVSIPTNNNLDEPKRELIVQEVAENVNKYNGDKKDFHFNKYWADISGGIYTINEKDNSTYIQYKKNMGNEWTYMAAPVEGKFSDFKYINLKVTGEKGKKLFLKIEESAIELKAKFFTLNGNEQILTMDISDVKSKKKLDALKQIMLFASPGEIEDGSFSILDAWFSTESPTVNRYLGDKEDFHFNKYWEDIFNHGVSIEENNEITSMTFEKQPDNNWILASTAVDGKFSDFNYVTLNVKGEAGQKFLLKLENGDNVYGEKLVELSGEEESVVVELKKDVDGLDSLKEVRVFPNAGEPEGGKLDIIDAWFSVEKPEGLKEAGEAAPSGTDSSYINGWKIEEWTKYDFKDINGLTKVTYDNPAPWANFTYNVEGKISGNNIFNLYLNSEGCDHVMIKLRGKFKNIDPVGGFNVYEEVEIFNGKIKQGETNLQVDITDAIKELGYVSDVVMFVESNQDVKELDRVGSLTFGQPKFTFGEVVNNESSSNNEWVVGEWTGYTSEIKDGFTRIKYDNVEPWANISYNIKNLLKDNNILELKLNSNGCDHIQIKLRGKYLNSDPGYKVYEEALVFDGKLNNGEKVLKLDLTEAINQLGRQNITDIMMFIESNQLVNGLDRKGSLDIYTPIFKKGVIADSNTENPSNPNQNSNEWIVEEWTGYTSEIKSGFTIIKYDNIEPWANIRYNIKNLLKDNNVLELKLNSNGCDHVQIKLRGKYLNSDPGYKVYEEVLVFDSKINSGEKTLKLDLTEAINQLGRKNVTELMMFIESNQTISGLDRKGSLDIYTPIFKKEAIVNPTPETPEQSENEEKNKWVVEAWTGYKAEIKDGFTRIQYDNVQPWASITYNIKDMLKDNSTLELKLNSNGCDHVQIKIRGKYLNSDPGYKVYEEELAFEGKLTSGEKVLKIDLKDIINKLGRENITDIVMFVESNDTIEGLDKKGSLDIYTPVFNKEVVVNPNPEQPEETPIEDTSEWEVGIWTGYIAEINDGFTRIKYDNPAPWANINYNVKDLVKDNNILELKLNSDGCEYIQIKLRGKYLNSDPGYEVYEEETIFDGKINNGESTLNLNLKDAIDKLGRENISDIIMFIDSSQLVNVLDRKGSLDIHKPIFKKGDIINPEQPETPNENNGEWVVGEWTGYNVEIKDGFTRVQYDNPAEWANINYNIKELLQDNTTLQLKLNSDGCDHVQIKIRGRYLNNDPGYDVYEEKIIFDEKITNGEKAIELDLTDVIDELGRENITDIVMFVESNESIDGLDRKGSLDIYTPVFSKEAAEKPNPEQPEDSIPDYTPGGDENVDTSVNGWLIQSWTGYKSENKNEFTRISYNNPEPWASITYNIKDMLKDNNTLELKLNSDGCDHLLIKIRGKYLNSDKGYAEYEEETIFDEKINIGKNTLDLNLKNAIDELGRENITDIIMFIESSQAVNDLDRKGSLDIYKPVFKEVEDKPEQPSEVITGTKKYELDITKEQLEELGGKITDVILFVESDESLKDIDRTGEIELLETALLNEEGKKQKINNWTTDLGWNQYQILTEETKTIIKYNNVENWATIWGKVSEDNTYNSKISIIFNTNGCDHLMVKLKGESGKEIELGKDYVKNMITSEKPEEEQPEAPEELVNNLVKLDVNDEILSKLGGAIKNILIFVESNPYGGEFDRSGKLEIVETTFKNELGDTININNWTTDLGWNQYQISNENNKTMIEYNNVQDWAHIKSEDIDYKEGYNKIEFKLNSIGCDHVTIKLVGINEVEEEVKNITLKQ